MKLFRLKSVMLSLIIILSLSLFKVNAQIITTVAGNGILGFSGDGGSATAASIRSSEGVAVDVNGNLYIADTYNNRIRKVDINGIISTVAGNGKQGFSGDGDSATKAELATPSCVVVDGFGNLFIADYGNGRVRKVNTNGIISTLVGDSATKVGISSVGLTLDATGNLYIADFDNNRIRKLSTNGIISTVAGNGTKGYSGDGDSATAAKLYFPSSVAVDAYGNLFIADEGNHRIRKVSTNGIISTIAGNGIGGYSGDGGNAASAKLNAPTCVLFDAGGSLYIADHYNNRIRKISTNGIITTVAGNGIQGFGGDGGSATNAEFDYPISVAFDTSGNLFIADYSNNRIRKVTYKTLPVTINSFLAKAKNNGITINWQASTELTTAKFIIQHSTDGISFTTIGTVKAIGSGANGYEFIDNNPANGTNYYRLESVDRDGASSFSKVVSAEIVDSKYEIVVVPNPVKSVAIIKGNHIALVQVIDNIGRVVKTVTLKDATNPVLSVSGLLTGGYHLRVQTTDGKVTGLGMVKE